MNIEKFESIVLKGENEKLDFKKEWYKDNDYNKKELIKDLLGLINGNPHSIGQNAFLIIGVKEERNNELSFHDCNISKDLEVLKREILQNLNNYSNPKVTKIKIKTILYERKNILIIEIPQHDYLIELSKDLRLPAYRKYDVLYRIGESTEVARREEIKVFNKKINNYFKKNHEIKNKKTIFYINLKSEGGEIKPTETEGLFVKTDYKLIINDNLLRKEIIDMVLCSINGGDFLLKIIIKGYEEYKEQEEYVQSNKNKNHKTNEEQEMLFSMQRFLMLKNQRKKNDLEEIESTIIKVINTYIFKSGIYTLNDHLNIVKNIINLIIKSSIHNETKLDIWIEKKQRKIHTYVFIENSDFEKILEHLKIKKEQLIRFHGIEEYFAPHLPHSIIIKYIIPQIAYSVNKEIKAKRLTKEDSLKYHYYLLDNWFIGLG